MKQATICEPTREPQTLPEVVREMAAHFSRTGVYRAEDICRVLGDPAGGVILDAAPTVETAYRQMAGR